MCSALTDLIDPLPQQLLSASAATCCNVASIVGLLFCCFYIAKQYFLIFACKRCSLLQCFSSTYHIASTAKLYDIYNIAPFGVLPQQLFSASAAHCFFCNIILKYCKAILFYSPATTTLCQRCTMQCCSFTLLNNTPLICVQWNFHMYEKWRNIAYGKWKNLSQFFGT